MAGGTDSHTRNNYPNVILSGQQNFWLEDIGTSSAYLQFLETNYSNDPLLGYQVSYHDIMYRYNGSLTMETYTFQDSGSYDKNIYIYPYAGTNFFTYCSTGVTDLSVFAITSSGVTITNIGPATDYYGYTENSWFGNRYVLSNYTANDFTSIQSKLINEYGEVVDSLYLSLGSSYNKNGDSRFGFYFINTPAAGGQQYYVNDLTTGFTSMNYYGWWDSSNYYWKNGNYESPSQFVFLNEITLETQVITKDFVGNIVTLPNTNGSWNLRIGSDRYLYVFGDPSDDQTHIELYDFNGNLKNQIKTSYTSWYDTYVVKDRYMTWFDNGSEYDYYLISDSTIANTIVSNSYDYLFINDYIWW